MVLGPERRKEAEVQLLAAILTLSDKRGYPPTYRELGAHLGIAHSAIYRRVKLLSQGGLVDEDPKAARSLRVSDDGRRALFKYATGNDKPPAVGLDASSG